MLLRLGKKSNSYDFDSNIKVLDEKYTNNLKAANWRKYF